MGRPGLQSVREEVWKLFVLDVAVNNGGTGMSWVWISFSLDASKWTWFDRSRRWILEDANVDAITKSIVSPTSLSIWRSAWDSRELLVVILVFVSWKVSCGHVEGQGKIDLLEKSIVPKNVLIVMNKCSERIPFPCLVPQQTTEVNA